MSNPHPHLPSRTDLQAAIDRATASKDAFELIHTSQPNWPYPNTSSSTSTAKPHIVIMDSSFNPPHFAHLAMAASSLPPPLTTSSVPPVQFYSARLLLFSVRNIEKIPKAGDASIIQRLEMTIILAHRLANTAPLEGGIAVGILNEPTFVGKSRIIHNYLLSYKSTGPKAKLSFLIGTDTLTRFFEPKFYENMGGMDKASRDYFGDGGDGEEGSLLICGRRGEGKGNREVEDEVLGREEVRPWVERGCVRMLGSGEEGFEEVSSSRIRKAVKGGDRITLGELVPEEIVDYIDKEGLYTE